MLMRARRNARKTLLELRNASARPSVLDQGVDDGIVVSRENWVDMWLDMRHVVHASGGMISAFRGVSFEGQPMWMVRHIDKALGYHSLAPDAGSAIIEAEAAWEERKRVRRRWREVESLARDLLLGRVSLRITIEDAYESALCETGIRAFMSRIGLGRVRHLPGRAVSLLMKIEPQVGFVIFRAWERVNGFETQMPLAREPSELATAGSATARTEPSPV